jgi:heme-degrading monooxygenase HmoA
MILRIVQGRVKPGRSHEFHARVEAALSPIRQQAGLIHVEVGLQRHADAEDYAFSSLWQDLESIYRWVGSNDLLCVPAAPGSYEDLVDSCVVQHYEVFEGLN